MVRSNNTVLLVCDMQIRFAGVIHNFEHVEGNVGCLVDVFKVLSLPIIATTQKRVTFGDTVPSINKRFNSPGSRVPVIDKSKFSMLIPEVDQFLSASQANSAVVVGIETHICVLQTTLELLSRGKRVTVITDAVSSSTPQESRVALQQMVAAGARVTTLESWTFSQMETAEHPSFKEVSQILKLSKAQRQSALKALL